MFNVASIKKLLGPDYEVQARANGQISVGIHRDKLASTTDRAKVELIYQAHAKLVEAGLAVGDLDSVFKAANPPLRNTENPDAKGVWRSYIHLLLDPPTGGTVTQADPGPEYLRTLLAAGVNATDAIRMVQELKGAKPVPAKVVDADADADTEVPV